MCIHTSSGVAVAKCDSTIAPGSGSLRSARVHNSIIDGEECRHVDDLSFSRMGLRQAVGGAFVGAGNGFAAPVDGMLLGTPYYVGNH